MISAKVSGIWTARQWFNEHLKANGLTQTDVANQCEVNIKTLQIWLASGRIPRKRTSAICDALAIEVKELEEHFTITDSDSGSRSGLSALEGANDLTALFKAVKDAGFPKVTLADLETAATVPADVNNPSPDEVAVIRHFLQKRVRNGSADE